MYIYTRFNLPGCLAAWLPACLPSLYLPTYLPIISPDSQEVHRNSARAANRSPLNKGMTTSRPSLPWHAACISCHACMHTPLLEVIDKEVILLVVVLLLLLLLLLIIITILIIIIIIIIMIATICLMTIITQKLLLSYQLLDYW